MAKSAEEKRLFEEQTRTKNWKRWGTYLPERQWGTVREDYSSDGSCWDYFPHDHSRSRAYRWGEDGLLGWTDRQCRLCFAPALWNGKDGILKERLFGLTGPEGNHGEDVKELYYYLDATPTHSYAKALYKYPQQKFPYQELLDENRKRGLAGLEFELIDTGLFNAKEYFDVLVEYAKNTPDDILIRITVTNRCEHAAPVTVLPQLWFRNTWDWQYPYKESTAKPNISFTAPGTLSLAHETLGNYSFCYETKLVDTVLFTENETNILRHPAEAEQATVDRKFFKDAFHEYIIQKNTAAVSKSAQGTKATPVYSKVLQGGESFTIKLRLFPTDQAPRVVFGRSSYDAIFAQRTLEADEFYKDLASKKKKTRSRDLSTIEHEIVRQASAGLLWTKQFYYYVVEAWLQGEKTRPVDPVARAKGRNGDWNHLFSRDILSMPDKWEYPWFAAWDLAFHMIPFSAIDSDFAKQQLSLMLREWYLHPNGQIPAYEFAFSDVNPPVHAWAAYRVYKMTASRGQRDTTFLESVFQKLLLNFTWWVNRKDPEGNNLFSGGFLGMDNIGVFDRSRPLPTGGHLQQADGTAWMAFYCLTMLSMSLELAKTNNVYEDMASKFFEHFVNIADSMNYFNGCGLWDDEDGFYYDQLRVGTETIPLKTRSLVGLLPIIAVEILEDKTLERFPQFAKRLRWFVENRSDLLSVSEFANSCADNGRRMLSIVTKERLEKLLRYVLDEKEFLSPYGIRSVSKVHEANPYTFKMENETLSVGYVPGEGNSHAFGGNSNWRGPIWFPMNFLLIEALERYYHFFEKDFKVECPVGSGTFMTLKEVATELSRRLASAFIPEGESPAAAMQDYAGFAKDTGFNNLHLFPEYFHGDTGRGLGAMHQTGWTALIINFIFTGAERHN